MVFQRFFEKDNQAIQETFNHPYFSFILCHQPKASWNAFNVLKSQKESICLKVKSNINIVLSRYNDISSWTKRTVATFLFKEKN